MRLDAASTPTHSDAILIDRFTPHSQPTVSDNHDPDQAIRIVLSQILVLVEVDFRGTGGARSCAWMRMNPNAEMGSGSFEVDESRGHPFWTRANVDDRRSLLCHVRYAGDAGTVFHCTSAEHQHALRRKQLAPRGEHQISRNDEALVMWSQLSKWPPLLSVWRRARP